MKRQHGIERPTTLKRGLRCHAIRPLGERTGEREQRVVMCEEFFIYAVYEFGLSAEPVEHASDVCGDLVACSLGEAVWTMADNTDCEGKSRLWWGLAHPIFHGYLNPYANG